MDGSDPSHPATFYSADGGLPMTLRRRREMRGPGIAKRPAPTALLRDLRALLEEPPSVLFVRPVSGLPRVPEWQLFRIRRIWS